VVDKEVQYDLVLLLRNDKKQMIHIMAKIYTSKPNNHPRMVFLQYHIRDKDKLLLGDE